jgi:hypothetical protein
MPDAFFHIGLAWQQGLQISACIGLHREWSGARMP